MISPIEIRKNEFRRSFRGYNEREVNSFLIRVAEEFEALYHENAESKERIQRLEFEMARYKKMEETLNQTLVLAQQTAEELRVNAEKEAGLLLEGARIRIVEIFGAYEEILKRLQVFQSELRSFLSANVEMMEGYDRRIAEISSFFYSQDMKEILNALGKVGEPGNG